MYIGIDLGTSAIKLVLVDIQNHQLVTIKEVERKQPILNPKENWSEQDPNLWFDIMIDGLQELTKNHHEISGISFSGQMHGLVLLDKNDHILRPAILWNDQRTEGQVIKLNQDLTKDFIYKETNNMVLTGFTAPKILWVKENEPEIFKQIDKIMLPKDYLVYRLTQKHVTDITDISGSLFYNVKENKYSEAIIKYLNIHLNQLPKVLQSTDPVGKMLDQFVDLLNLSSNPTIFPGGGDQAVGACLTSTFNEGDASISIGTSGVVFTPISNIDAMKENVLHCFRHVNNHFFLMGVTLSAAASIQWFKEKIMVNTSYEDLYASIESTDKNNLLFLPYLNGERTPINNPNAKGVIMNITSQTGQKDMFKSVLEGVAFSLRAVLDEMHQYGIELKTAAIIGGGTRNYKFTQILADVLQINLYTVKQNMGTALGAAMIAMVGNQAFKDFESIINKKELINHMIHPNQSMKIYYDNKYKDYHKLYHKLSEFF
ncbi:MAG: xylulokinase [Candidatus Izemoplasmatales bacterium]